MKFIYSIHMYGTIVHIAGMDPEILQKGGSIRVRLGCSGNQYKECQYIIQLNRAEIKVKI